MSGSGLISQGITVNFKANLDGLTSGANQARGILGGFTSALGPVGKGLAVVATAAVGVGITATKMAGDFQQSMLKVAAYAGLSKTQTDSMSQSILSMASAVGVGPKELADALYPIISSGYGASDALNILKLSAETAAASGAKTAVVADALTTSLGAMHAPASQAGHYMDMLNKIVSIGKGEVPQYAAVIGKLSLAAAGAGVDFATTGAALADLTTHGFPSVAQASTSLGGLMTQLGVKTDALAQHAQKAGIAFDAHKFATLSLSDKLDYLQKITGGNQGELLKLVGGSTLALKAFNALEGSTGDLKKNLDAMKNSAGATDDAFKAASSGLNASMNRLKATFQVGMIEIGQKLLPIATQGVNLLNTAMQNIGPVVSNVGNVFKSVNLSGLGDAFKDFGPPLQNIANLMGGQLTQEFKDFSDAAKQVGSWFKSDVIPAIKDAWPGFKDLAMTILNTVIPAFIQIRGTVMDVIEHAFQKFGPIIEKIVPPLIRFAGIIAQDLSNGIKFVTPYILDATKAIGKFAGEIIDRVAPIISNFITGITPLVEAFMAQWNRSWPMISTVLRGVWDEIAGIVKIAWSVVSGIIKIGLDILSGNWKQAWTDFKDMLGGIWDGIKTYLKGAMEAIFGLFRPLLEAFSHVPGPAGDMARGVLNAFDGMKDGAAQKSAEMRAKVLDNTAKMHTEAASRLDQMRQDLIKQMQNTSDPVQKHALEMKINTVSKMEEMHVSAASKAEDMKKKVVNHVKDMKNQSQGGIAGVGKYFSDKFTEAKNGVVNAFGTVGHWFQDRWKDIQNIWGGVGKWFQDRWSDIAGAWKVGVDKVAGFFKNLYDHSYLVQHIVDGIRDTWNTAIKWIQDTWKGITDWLTNKWNEMNKSSQDTWKKFSDGVRDAWNTISGIVSGAWNTYIAKPLSDLWKNISTSVSNLWTNYVSKPVSDFWKSLSTTFSNAWNDYVSKPVSDLWTSLSTTVSGWATDAWTWGVNLITGLANGITSAVGGALHTALDGAATAIKNVIGWHSPTKEGPGSDSDKWAPALVNMMSAGLIAGVPQIQNAVNMLAKPIATGLNPVSNLKSASTQSQFKYPTSGTGGPGGSQPVVHVHVYPVVQPNDMYVDGYKLTQQLGPHIANKIRLEQQVRRH